MKTVTTFVLGLAIVALFASRETQADHHHDADKKAILQIENDWAQAMVDGDGAWFKKTLTDDFKNVLPEGQVWDRDKFADAWTTGLIDCSKSEIEELDVRFFGDTAIVIGQGKVAGIASGKTFEHTEKWTDVYVKRDGGWKSVSCHVCTLKE